MHVCVRAYVPVFICVLLYVCVCVCVHVSVVTTCAALALGVEHYGVRQNTCQGIPMLGAAHLWAPQPRGCRQTPGTS